MTDNKEKIMKVLFAAPENAWGGILQKFREAHPEIDFTASGAYAAESLAGYDVLIPTMADIDAELLATADSLKLIQQMGAGLEGIDMAAAASRGIQVANVPAGASPNADSVAELGIFLMLGLARRAWLIDENLQEGRLGRPMGITLQGKTVGLIGLGDIGQALLRRLRAFNVRLIGIKARPPASGFAEEHGLDWVGVTGQLPELLAEADFIVLSLPDNENTHGLFNRETFSLMRRGAMLINLGRGGVVDHDGLLEALRDGTLGGAGLDVFWQEPPDPQDPVFGCNVIATPHIGGMTEDSLEGIFQRVSDNLRRLQDGRELLFRKV